MELVVLRQWIATAERSSSLTRIAATETVSLSTAFLELETAICIYLLNLPAPSTEVNGEFVRANASCRDLEQAAGIVLRSVIELRCGSLELTPRN